jgi:CheY-like chemotaxis protein
MIQRVLVIDDSETDQFICSCILEEYNGDIEILKAYDGKEGLEILADLDTPPEIILLDINMPRMNGHEFLAEYTKTHENPASVVVMLTSSSQERDKEDSMQYKFVKEYQEKPLSVEAIQKLAALIST